MLSHAVYSEGECEAVLNEFTSLIDENSDSVEPFSELISGYFFVLHRMTTDNVKLFFRAVFRLYDNRPSLVMQKNNLNAMIPLLLHSADNVQPIFGVLASLIKLEAELLLEWDCFEPLLQLSLFSIKARIAVGSLANPRNLARWCRLSVLHRSSTREEEAAIGLQEAWLSDYTSEKTRRDRWSLVLYALVVQCVLRRATFFNCGQDYARSVVDQEVLAHVRMPE
ncbi:unnamed protein product [Angiostrongylus costaricensis]|uniref:FAT domain-containing protein n=1 Tax=Angiostrongylus costaricensis TaxID=334426 RepID=A0A0R3PHX6_ANGCS|nr:unnamed protein product [Angiostrongylus costaricensis]